MSVNTRRLCLDVITAVMEDGVFCNTALHECLNKNPALDIKERAFLSALAEGVVERCIEMDYIIGKFSDKPVGRLKPAIRNILRMAVYQIMYMDQVPDSAAVNEAVKLTVKKGYGGLRGFVNGVLRNIARKKDTIRYPDADSNIEEYISAKYSVPEWLVDHFFSEMSVEDTISTAGYYIDSKDIVIRYTGTGGSYASFLSELDNMGIEYKHGHIFDYACRLGNAGRVDRLPGYVDGRFVVQDESSMIPGHIAAAWINNNGKAGTDTSKTRVLDMCAAPGGKTLHIAGSSGDKVSVDSCDISEYKVSRIRDNAARLKLNNINGVVSDALSFDENKKGRYDVVVADLPCSGLGVLAKKPDIKYNVSEASMNELVQIQRKMLDNAAAYVAPGGLLVYSTCTLNKHENEENAGYFEECNPDFRLIDMKQFFDGAVLERIACAFTEQGYIKVIPGVLQSDGFFVAAYQKER